MTQDVLNIASDLRLVRLDAPPAEALSWCQKPKTLRMVDGKRALHARAAGARSVTSHSARMTFPSSSTRRPAGAPCGESRDWGALRADAQARLEQGPRGRGLRLERRIPMALLGRRL